MNPLNQVNIEEKSTIYDLKLMYHSDMKCENYDAKMIGVAEGDGKITFSHEGRAPLSPQEFVFTHSDPDRVIAIAQMMMAFAQMVKNENKKAIDTSVNV